jgi:hypothetical protein
VELGEAGLQDTVVGAGEEHGVAQPGVGDLVAVGVRDALDEAVLAHAPQVWDEQQVLDTAAAWAVSHLGDRDAVLIVDETAGEKSSADAGGAARQYSGTVGGIALCQVAVTLTLATSRGHALIGRALYLPGTCAADEEHRELAGVPGQVMSGQAGAGRGLAGPRA